MAAPTYIGMIVHFKKDKEECMQFFFCNNDIEQYTKGTRQRWIQSRSDIPNIRSMKIGTNLVRKEILYLESTSF
jgi:hypothetical protein